MERYIRNKNMISDAENEKLNASKVCVVGCGGLGGYVIEMLARIGVGTITAVDADVFEESNLNRQVISLEENMGRKKAAEAAKRVERVNSTVNVNVVEEFMDEENVESIINGHCAVVDALDDIKSRIILQDACEKCGIPMVHGAIAAWYGQVCTIFPGERTLDLIYKRGGLSGKENTLGNPSFTPGLVASMQVAEIIKIILQRGELLRKKLLFADMLNNDYEVFALKNK